MTSTVVKIRVRDFSILKYETAQMLNTAQNFVRTHLQRIWNTEGQLQMTNNQAITDIFSFPATLIISHLILFEKVFS